MTGVHYQIPPRPSLDAHRAMHHMQDTLQSLGLTPDPRPADWAIDARLYAHRHRERKAVAGHGAPVAAVCLRLHEPARGLLQWLFEHPARGVNQWATPDPVASGRRLEVLTDAARRLHSRDLAPVRRLLADRGMGAC